MNLLDADKTTATYIEQKGNDQLVITHLHHISHIMEFNDRARKNSNDIWNKADKEFKFIGRIPATMADDWERQGILPDQKELKKVLNKAYGGMFLGTKKRI